MPAPAPLSARSEVEPATERTWSVTPTFRVVVAPAPVVIETAAVVTEVPRPTAMAPLERLITPLPVVLETMPEPPVETTSALALITRPPVPAVASMPAVERPVTVESALTWVEPAPVEEAMMPEAPP